MKNNQLGFTLIETLVALGVASLALTGITSLIIVNIGNARAVEQNLVAANLAQEGLEVAKNIRDNDWNTGKFGDSFVNGEYRIQWNDTRLRPIDGNPELLFDTNTGFYSYDTGDPTVFRRKLVVEKISDNQIKVNVVVEWNPRGRSASVEAELHLFDWF